MNQKPLILQVNAPNEVFGAVDLIQQTRVMNLKNFTASHKVSVWVP